MNLVKKVALVLIPCFFITAAYCEPVYAIVGAVKNLSELSIEAIKSLAILGKTKGSASVAKELAALSEKVPSALRAKFFESAYAKILVEQGRISPTQADEWIKNLSSISGFRNTMSKMVGASDHKFVGHLFEMNMANQLHKSGYKIVSIGEKYNDAIKLGESDIDIIAKKGKTTFIFELKNYDSRLINFKEVNNFERDMQTLAAYASEHNGVVPVFISKNVPANKTIKEILDAYGEKNNVNVLYGDPTIATKALELLK